MNSVSSSIQTQYAQSNRTSITLTTSKLCDFFRNCCCCSNDTHSHKEFVAISLDETHDSTSAHVAETAHPILRGKEASQSKSVVKESSTVLNPPSYSSEAIQLMIKKVKPIAANFTVETSIADQRKAHEKAKEFLEENLNTIEANVTFVSPPPLSQKTNVSTIAITPLEGIFYWEHSEGIAENIQRDGNRNEDNIILYGAPSQFNGVCGQCTPLPGRAVRSYQSDPMEGTQAQLQFHPHQVELINCGANRGFNGLINILNKKTISTVIHGYFKPDLECAKEIISALSKDGIEYICVANRPYDKTNKMYGTKPVHMLLMSAPVFDDWELESNAERNQIEFLCALQGFRAQFQYCIDLAQRENKPVIFKATGIGLGVYGNQEIHVAKGFYAAAKEFAARLDENKVLVRLQVMGGTGRTRELANLLHLREWI